MPIAGRPHGGTITVGGPARPGGNLPSGQDRGGATVGEDFDLLDQFWGIGDGEVGVDGRDQPGQRPRRLHGAGNWRRRLPWLRPVGGHVSILNSSVLASTGSTSTPVTAEPEPAPLG